MKKMMIISCLLFSIGAFSLPKMTECSVATSSEMITRATPKRYKFPSIPPKKLQGMTRISYEYDAKLKCYYGYYL